MVVVVVVVFVVVVAVVAVKGLLNRMAVDPSATTTAVAVSAAAVVDTSPSATPAKVSVDTNKNTKSGEGGGGGGSGGLPPRCLSSPLSVSGLPLDMKANGLSLAVSVRGVFAVASSLLLLPPVPGQHAWC